MWGCSEKTTSCLDEKPMRFGMVSVEMPALFPTLFAVTRYGLDSIITPLR